MAWKLLMVAAAASVLTMGAEPAPAPKPVPPPPPPYLVGPMSPDTYKILPPAPLPGTVRYEADRKMFLETRKLEGTPRWALALNDDNGGRTAEGPELRPGRRADRRRTRRSS